MPSAISNGRWTPWALLNAIDVKCKGDVIKLTDRYKRTSKSVEDQSTQCTTFTSQLPHADKTTAEEPSAGEWQLFPLLISTDHQWKRTLIQVRKWGMQRTILSYVTNQVRSQCKQIGWLVYTSYIIHLKGGNGREKERDRRGEKGTIIQIALDGLFIEKLFIGKL